MVQRESSVMTPCVISYFTVYKPTIQEPAGNNVAAATINQGQVTFSTLTSFVVASPISISVRNSFIVSSAITAGSSAAAGEMEKDLRHQLNVELTGSLFYPSCGGVTWFVLFFQSRSTYRYCKINYIDKWTNY